MESPKLELSVLKNGFSDLHIFVTAQLLGAHILVNQTSFGNFKYGSSIFFFGNIEQPEKSSTFGCILLVSEHFLKKNFDITILVFHWIFQNSYQSPASKSFPSDFFWIDKWHDGHQNLQNNKFSSKPTNHTKSIKTYKPTQRFKQHRPTYQSSQQRKYWQNDGWKM